MNHAPRRNGRHGLRLACAILTGSLSLPLAALEEDASQPLVIAAQSSDFSLDGVLKLFGSDTKPVRITQGTLEITGHEAHIEQEGETITTVTVFGEPAHFQQQLNATDPGPIHASGLTLRFDNSAQRVSIIEQAEIVLPNGTRSNGYQFEYDLSARRMRSVDGPDGEPVRIVIPPGAGQ
jgi:lipopolysaccharide transport protein LptA